MPNCCGRRHLQSKSKRVRHTLREVITSRKCIRVLSVFVLRFDHSPLQTTGVEANSLAVTVASVFTIVNEPNIQLVCEVTCSTCTQILNIQLDFNLLHSCVWHGKLSIVPMRIFPSLVHPLEIWLAHETKGTSGTFYTYTCVACGINGRKCVWATCGIYIKKAAISMVWFN